MIIYIYGSKNFKKDIHDVLNHSNIKFRLDEHGEIKDLETLEELKEAIEDNPNNIYLIDDEKIIKKNSINKKIKFLQPKDAIEQEYLLDNGIGDISVDSIEELSKHIKNRLDSVISDKESDEIQESIVEIVEDAYEQDESKETIQLDDELSSLLSSSKTKEDDNKNEDISSDNLSFEEDFDSIELIEEPQIEDVNIEEINEVIQGDNMADEFSEFDSLNEDDILAALDGFETADEIKRDEPQAVASSNSNNSKENIDLSGSNVDDIAKLISQLLNNKTLEITVKVKD